MNAGLGEVEAVDLGNFVGNYKIAVVGVYVDIAILPRIKRDLDPPPDKDSGTAFLLTMGADFTLVRNQGFLLLVRGGGQYGSYGGVEGLSDGLASTAGLATGFYIGSGLTFTLSSDAVFASAGDMIIASYVGLLVEF